MRSHHHLLQIEKLTKSENVKTRIVARRAWRQSFVFGAKRWHDVKERQEHQSMLHALYRNPKTRKAACIPENIFL